MEPLVIGSKIASNYETYSRYAALGTLISIIVLGLVSGFLVYRRFHDVVISIAVGSTVAVSIVFPLCFALTIMIPSFAYSNRRSLLEAKFPLLAMTLSLLLAAGLGVTRAFENLEKRFLEELKFFDLEIKLINSYIRIGMPVDEAMQRVASITPSLSIKELLIGLASAARVGGDPSSVVNSIMSNYISRYSLLVEKTVNDLGIMMEIYLAFALLIPILLGSIAVLFLLSPIRGLSFDMLMFLTVFIVIPIISVAILIIIDTIVSKLRV